MTQTPSLPQSDPDHEGRSAARVLVVEDERLIAQDLQRRLGRLGYPVCGVVSSGEEAIDKAESQRPTVILMDIVLQGQMDGIEAADLIRTTFDIPIIYITAYGDEPTVRRANMARPSDYLVKPFNDHQLEAALEHALGR